MAGETRILFTSREALPAPFDRPDNRRELTRLAPEDAVQFVERVLNLEGAGTDADAAREEIEALVEAVHGHARTLALIAPSLRADGPARTRAALVDLMAQMEREFPESREQSVYAGVALSVQRLAPVNRERVRVRVLGVFHGAVDLDVLQQMMGWEAADCGALAAELIGTGLATADPYNHLTLNPALCPWLRERLAAAELGSLSARWGEAMGQYLGFLVQQRGRQTEVAATLTVLGLPNLFALLDRVQAAGEAEATIDLATRLYGLLQMLGRPRLLARVGHLRDTAARALGEGAGTAWSHARFQAERTRIEQQLAGGRLREAITGAEALLQRARATSGAAYPSADYDLAMACILVARVLQTAGGAGPALPLLDEARQGFEAIARDQGDQAAERMASVCLTEQGDCLLILGRLDEAAAAYEAAIARAERLGAERDLAVGQGQLGTVRLEQRRYREALDAYAQARARFTALGEQGSVAVAWYHAGRAYQASGNPGAAEDAYRESLAIKVRLGNRAGQASTLGQLGNLYQYVLNRPEESVAFYRQAADLYVEIGDEAGEGRVRGNLGDTLWRLGRLDEARRQVQRAIECKAPFGHAAEPWKTWAILADIETAAHNLGAAAAAMDQARAAFLAYRRDGGENHSLAGRLALAVTGHLRAGDPAATRSLLRQIAADPDWQADEARTFIQTLDAIAAGRRDPALAEAPGLTYDLAAEVQLLLETLP
jgi:tetratricopeptide (TPR) repeat protein